MPAEIVMHQFDTPLASRLGAVGEDEVVLDWLGQAGFLLRT